MDKVYPRLLVRKGRCYCGAKACIRKDWQVFKIDRPSERMAIEEGFGRSFGSSSSFNEMLELADRTVIQYKRR